MSISNFLQRLRKRIQKHHAQIQPRSAGKLRVTKLEERKLLDAAASLIGGAALTLDSFDAIDQLTISESATAGVGALDFTLDSGSWTSVSGTGLSAAGNILTVDAMATAALTSLRIDSTNPTHLTSVNSSINLQIADVAVVNGGDISFNAAANDFDSFSATGTSLLLKDADAVELGDVSVSSNLGTTAGDITNAAGSTISVGGIADFTAASINLDDSGGRSVNFGSVQFISVGDVTISENSAIHVSADSSGADIDLNAGGSLTVASDVTVTATNVILTANESATDVGDIGTSTDPFEVDGSLLTTFSNGDQHLATVGSINTEDIDSIDNVDSPPGVDGLQGAGTVTFYAGDFHVNDGHNVFGAAVVQDGASLGGDGQLTGFNLQAGSTLAVTLNGTNAATDYDQLNVDGIVTLAGDLSIATGFTAAANDSFIIIDNVTANAVSGTFNGLTEGAIFVADGQAFHISYIGGDGNDVVLTSARHEYDFSGANFSAVEGSSITATLNRTGNTSIASTVEVVVGLAGGATAAEATDFTARTVEVEFAAGATSANVNIATAADTIVEDDELVSLTLQNFSTGGAAGTIQPSAVVTIENDDIASLSISDVTVNESDSTATFTITSSNASESDVAVSVALNNLTTSPGDVVLGVVSATINGDSSTITQTVTVAITDDLRVEGTETYSLDLSAATYNSATDATKVTIGDSSGTGTINDNDRAAISFDSTTASIDENEVATAVAVSLNITATGTVGAAGLDRTISVDVNQTGGTANGTDPDADFTFTNSTVTFGSADGTGTSFTKTVGLDVHEDIIDSDAETVVLSLESLSDGSVTQASIGGNNTHTLTINDDDTASAAAFDLVAGGGAVVVSANGANLDVSVGGVVQTSRTISGLTTLTLNGSTSDDSVTLDFSNGAFATDVVFDGAAGTDSVFIIGATGGSDVRVIYHGVDSEAGVVDVDGTLLTYSDIENNSLNISGTDNLIFDFAGGDLAIEFDRLNATNTQLTGNSFTTTNFTGPADSLTVNFTDANNYTVDFTDFSDDFKPTNGIDVNGNASGGNISLNVDQLGGFDGAFDVDLGTGTDSVAFANTAQTFSSLNISAESITATSASVSVSGATTLNAGAAGTISLTNAANNFGGNVQVVNADTATIHDTDSISFAGVATQGNFTVQAGATAGFTTSATIGGNLDVSAADVVLAAGTVAVTGTADVTATGSITSGADDGVADLTSTVITLVSGSTGIGTATDSLDVSASSRLDASTTATAADFYIDGIGDLKLGKLNAGTGTIAAAATDGIVDAWVGDGAGNENIIAANAALRAASGIGNADQLDINVTNLAFLNTTSGNVSISDVAGGLTINAVDGLLTSANNSGSVTLAAASPITFAVDMTATGDVDAQAAESAVTNFDNVTVNNGVTVESTGGDVQFTAGDRIVINSTAVVRASGSGGDVTLNSGYADTDNDGSMILDGTIAANNTDGIVRLNLNADGSAVQSATGSITGNSLDLRSVLTTGSFDLDASVTNNVAVIAGSTDLAAVEYRDADTLTVGQVNSTSGISSSPGVTLYVMAGNLTLQQSITSGAGTVRLQADGATSAISQDSINGAIRAQALGVRSGSGGILLDSAANNTFRFAAATTGSVVFVDANIFQADTVAAAGCFTATTGVTGGGDVSLSSVAGRVFVQDDVVATGSGNVAITAANGDVTVTGAVTADGDTVTISTGGAINNGGLITAATVDLSAVSGIGNSVSLQTDATTLKAVNSTSNSIRIAEANDIAIDVVNNGIGTVTLSAGGNINGLNAGAPDIIAGVFTVDAAGGIDLDTTVTSLDASTSAGGSIDINETDAITLRDVDTADGSITITAAGAIDAEDVDSSTVDTDTNDITLTTANGDITAGYVDAGTLGDVLLNSAASIIDDGNAGTLLSADELLADAAGSISLATTISSANLSTSVAGDINIDETDGITLTDVDTTDGSITVDAGAAIVATDVSAAGAGSDVNLHTVAAGITATLVTATDAVVIDADAGNVLVGSVTAGSTATITADSHQINDISANPDATTDISAETVVLTAGTGIGNLADIDVTATNVSATVTGSGNIDISSVSNTDVSVMSLASGSGSIRFDQSGGGDVTFTGAVDSNSGGGTGRAITLTATNGLTVDAGASIDSRAGGGGDLILSGATINGTVFVGSGDVTIEAGALDTIVAGDLLSNDDISVTAIRDVIVAAAIDGAGDIVISGDSNSVGDVNGTDAAGGAWIQTAGNVQSTGGNVTITGSDVFATAATVESVLIDSDGVNSQVEADGRIVISDGSNAAAAAATIVNGRVASDSSITITAEDDVLFGADGDVVGSIGLVTVTAATGGASGGQVTMADGASITATTGYIIVSADGNISIGQFSSRLIVSVVSHNGMITDAGDSGGADINAGLLTLGALTGIGDDANALETQTDAASSSLLFAARTDSGDIHVFNSGSLTTTLMANSLGNFSGVTIGDDLSTGTDLQDSGQDNLILVASSPLLITSAITNNDGGNISLTSINDGGLDDHLTISGPLTITGGDATEDGAGNIFLNAGTDLVFYSSATTDAGGTINATAAGDILLNAGTFTTVNGHISLAAIAGQIAMVDGSTVQSTTGDIAVTANTDVEISSVATGANVVVTATNGAISDNGDADVDIVADAAELVAAAGSGDGNAIETAITSLTATSTMAGNIAVQESDAITLDSVTTADGAISITAGDSILATLIDANGDANDSVTLIATSGNIAAVSVTAADDVIVDSNAGEVIATSVTAEGGNIDIDAQATVTATDVTATSGGIDVTSDTSDVLVDTVTASGTAPTVTLTATAGSVLDSNNDAAVNVSAANGNVIIVAGMNIGAASGTDVFKSAADNPLEVDSAVMNLTATGIIAVHQTTDTSVVALNAGTGTVFLSSDADIDLSTATPTAARLSLLTTTGTITLPAVVNMVTDDLRIEANDVAAAGGNIDITTNRLLFKSGMSEEITVRTSTAASLALDVQTTNAGDGNLTINTDSNVTLTDLDCDDVALHVNNNIATINSSGNTINQANQTAVAMFDSKIIAGSLVLNGTGTYDLTNILNDTNILAGNNIGNIALIDVDDVTIDEVISPVNGTISGLINNGDVAVQTGTTLTLNEQLNADGHTIRLQSGLAGAGDIVQTATGTITAASVGFRQAGTGSIQLAAQNDVDTVAADNADAGGIITFSDSDDSDDSDDLVVGEVPGAVTSNLNFATLAGLTTNNGDITIDAGDTLALTEAVTAGTETVRFIANNNITQTATGIISADKVGVRQQGASGNVVLDDANVVNQLAVFNAAAGGHVAFNNSQALLIETVTAIDIAAAPTANAVRFEETSGIVTTNGDVLLNVDGTLTIDQQVNSGTADVRLLTDGDLTQAAAGIVTANNLGIIQQANSGIITLDADNDVNTLAATNAGPMQTLAFNDIDDLTIDTVAAQAIGNIAFAQADGLLTSTGDILLNADGLLTLNQQVNAGTADVRMTADGDIVQSVTGNITANELGIRQESSSGNVTLGFANDVDNLSISNAALGGIVAFNDTDDLTIDSVVAQTIGTVTFAETIGIASNSGDILLNAEGALTLNQQVSASAADVRIAADGPVTQASTGQITADELAVRQESAAGDIVLDSANDVNTFAASNIASAGSIVFVDVDGLLVGQVASQTIGPLTVAATSGLTTANGDILVNVGGTLDLNQAVNSGTANTRLVAEGTIQQTAAGIISANQLAVRQEGLTGNVLLDDANDVDILAVSSVSSGGIVAFNDVDDLTIGAVASQTIDQASVDATAGILTRQGDVILQVGDTLDIDQRLATTGGDTRIIANGVIQQSAVGVISTDELAVMQQASNADVLLDDGNFVNTVAISNPGGGKVAFNNSTTLTVAEVSAQTVGGISVATTSGITANNADILIETRDSIVGDGALTLTGQLNAGTANIYLTATSDITQSANGTIFASQLGVRQQGSTGDIVLDDSNDVDILAAQNDDVAGNIVFRDIDELTIDTVAAATCGNMTFATIDGIVGGSTGDALLDINGRLDINQQLNMDRGDVRILADGDVVQAATGPITANQLGILQQAAAGDVLLDDANNVDSVAIRNDTVGGIIGLNNVSNLTVDQVAAQTIGNIAFATTNGLETADGDILLNIDAQLSIAQQLNAVSADIRIVAEGSIDQTASGTITATDLGIRQEGGFGVIELGVAPNDVDNIAFLNAGETVTDPLVGTFSSDVSFFDVDDLTVSEISSQQISNLSFDTTTGTDTNAGNINLTSESDLTVNERIDAAHSFITDSIDESITLISRNGDFILADNTTISSDEDPTPGVFDDITGDELTIIAGSGGSNGVVRLGDNIEVRTDGGTARQVAPRPTAFAAAPTTGAESAFVTLTDAENMRSNLNFVNGGFLGELDLVFGVAGEENLEVVIDWGVVSQTSLTSTGPAGDATTTTLGTFVFDADDADKTIFYIDEGGQNYVIPHLYAPADLITTANDRNGRQINPNIVGVRFSVAQHESINIWGNNATDPAGTVDTAPPVFTGTAAGIVDATGVMVLPAGQLALLSSTDSNGLNGFSQEATNQSLPLADNRVLTSTGRPEGLAEWEFLAGPSPAIPAVEQAEPEPFVAPRVEIPDVQPAVSEVPGDLDLGAGAAADSAGGTDVYLQIRRHFESDVAAEVVIQRITNNSFISNRDAFEQFVEDNPELQDGDGYEVWLITETGGQTVARPIVEFEITGGRPGPATEELPDTFEPYELKELEFEQPPSEDDVAPGDNQPPPVETSSVDGKPTTQPAATAVEVSQIDEATSSAATAMAALPVMGLTAAARWKRRQQVRDGLPTKAARMSRRMQRLSSESSTPHE